MDASKRNECLPNTRLNILKFIVDWVNDPAGEQNILWLFGVAGSGKSTLSTTIASILSDSGQLGAFLFFDRDVTERCDPRMVIRTLAYQLAASHPTLRIAIRTVIENNSNVLMLPLRLQFQRLILDPLLMITDTSRMIAVVLDALDECGTAGERKALLSVLSDGCIRLSPYIRIIVTSRPEIDIYNAFDPQHHILAYEMDITSPANSNDISAYFQHRMALICTQKRHLRLDADWPGEEMLCKLVQRASGLFVWAFTACEFMNGHSPTRRLDLILSGEAASGAEIALDVLYATALESVGIWDDEDFVVDFRRIMGIILVARQPLSSGCIDALSGWDEHWPSMHTISLLGCVLQQYPTVRVLHPSFADFLMTEGRCRRDTWFFNPPVYHRLIAFQCLDHMDTVLKRNMCNMTLGVDRMNESLSEDVSYACLFWIDHICVIKEDLAPVTDKLVHFLYQHFLHWFEAMGILRRSRDTISLLDCLLKWVSVSQSYAQLYHHLLEGIRTRRPRKPNFVSLLVTHVVSLEPLPTLLRNILFWCTCLRCQ
jgi:energy-coupling factor transporter ATP-binding protein EcfA2